MHMFLAIGTTIDIPGIGTKIVGHIQNPYPGRYRIRLDEKYKESIWIDVLNR